MKYLMGIIWIGCLMSSCYQPKEGCLDNRALNYDVSADRNCCCQFPALILSTDLKWLGNPFDPDSTYSLDTVPFQLLNIDLLISDCVLKTRGGMTLHTDSLKSFPTAEGTIDTEDDFGQIGTDHLTTQIPNFTLRAQADSLCFRLGIHPENLLPPEEEEHPLSAQNSGWTKERGWPILRVMWRTGKGLTDTVSTAFYNTTNRDKSLCLERTLEGELGGNTLVSLSFDIGVWLEGVDLHHPDSTQLWKQLPKSLN